MTTDDRRARFAGILAEVQENRRRLESCPGHRFPTRPELGKPWVCACCSGRMDATSALAYLEGWKAAGGDPLAVWPSYEAT